MRRRPSIRINPRRNLPPPMEVPPTEAVSCIRQNLFLGSVLGLDNLQPLGITHVLNLTDIPSNTPLEYKMASILDRPDADLCKLLSETIPWIERCLSSPDNKIFIHCAAGISRSASVVIAYLMYSEDLSYEQATEDVKTIRPIIDPNFGFCCSLQSLEGRLRSRNM